MRRETPGHRAEEEEEEEQDEQVGPRVDAAAAANTSAFEKMYLYIVRKRKGIFIPVPQAPKHIEAQSKEPSVIGGDAGVRVPRGGRNDLTAFEGLDEGGYEAVLVVDSSLPLAVRG